MSETKFETAALANGFKAVKSDTTNDKKHVDYKLYNSQGKYQTVDVKTYSSLLPDSFVVELTNNYGYQGWIYAPTDYIAINVKTHFNFYNLSKLRTYIDSKIINKDIWQDSRTNKEFYTIYSRVQMKFKDRWVIIPLKDIEHLIIKSWEIL